MPGGTTQAMPQQFTSWEAIYKTLRATFPDDRYHMGAAVSHVEPQSSQECDALAAVCHSGGLRVFWPAYLTLGASEQVDQLLNVTTIPRLTRCASSLASQFVMGTQPCEAFLSIFEGSGVP
jgi:hypothetical protein